jgi:serine/threonine-protein kinase
VSGALARDDLASRRQALDTARVEGSAARLGETLKGKYRLDELLGTGGMGEVYRAQNMLVNREVAIKILHAHHYTNKEVVSRFMQEAKAANAVRHRNIVDVLDIDKDDRGVPFIVQEYLEGEDLAARIERPPHCIDPDEALALLIPVIDGVALAHKNGVIHRDLKPDNIFLAKIDGEVVPKILDFGISKIEEEVEWRKRTGGGGAPMSQNARLTAAGASMGTPAYMSPEQIRDPRSVDARTDIWSLGVMLYEVLGGRMPFDADDLAGLFAVIHTQDAPALERVNPKVPKALARIVQRCMRPEPSGRYPDAHALTAALTEFRLRADEAGQARNPSASLLPSKPTSQPPRERRGSSERPAARDAVIDAPADTDPPEEPPARSMPPTEWELDLPSKHASAPSAKTSQPAPSSPKPTASSNPPPAAGILSFDDDDDDDVLGPDIKLELAEPVPSSIRSGPQSGTRPRVARTAAREAAAREAPSSRRGIAVRRRQGPKSTLVGAVVRMLSCSALVLALALGTPHLTPAGIDALRAAFGPLAALMFAAATLASAVALIAVATAGMRRISYTLFAAAIGMTVVTAACAAATGVLAAPGLIGGTFRKAALVAAPWGALAVVLGLAAFALLRARALRADEGSPTFAALLALSSAIGVCAAGYMLVLHPRASLQTISSMPLVPIEEATRNQLTRFAIVTAGRRALDPTTNTNTPPPPSPEKPTDP